MIEKKLFSKYVFTSFKTSWCFERAGYYLRLENKELKLAKIYFYPAEYKPPFWVEPQNLIDDIKFCKEYFKN